MNFTKGEIIYLNKPYGITSFKALARVRYLISKRLGVKRIKTGHAGTLDPLATGVLILCTGAATKKIDQLQYLAKEYVATLQLGATTVSYDMEHEENATFPTDHITEELINNVLKQFVGDIMQVPPEYSACKVNGTRAYDLMRKGKEVELKPKLLRIEEIELINFDAKEMQATIRVVCSKGTYIRALARDIGQALNSGAYLTSLCRTRIGNVELSNCISLEGFEEWLNNQEIEQ